MTDLLGLVGHQGVAVVGFSLGGLTGQPADLRD